MVPSQADHADRQSIPKWKSDKYRNSSDPRNSIDVSNDTTVPSQEDHADRQLEEAKSNVTHVTMVPSQEDHADALGC